MCCYLKRKLRRINKQINFLEENKPFSRMTPGTFKSIIRIGIIRFTGTLCGSAPLQALGLRLPVPPFQRPVSRPKPLWGIPFPLHSYAKFTAKNLRHTCEGVSGRPKRYPIWKCVCQTRRYSVGNSDWILSCYINSIIKFAQQASQDQHNQNERNWLKLLGSRLWTKSQKRTHCFV